MTLVVMGVDLFSSVVGSSILFPPFSSSPKTSKVYPPLKLPVLCRVGVKLLSHSYLSSLPFSSFSLS